MNKHIYEIKTKINNVYFVGVIEARISDPNYARAFANGQIIFQCRGADKIEFEAMDNALIIKTDCNYQYKYDRITENRIKGILIQYRHL